MTETGIIKAIRLKLSGGGRCVSVGSTLLEDVVMTIRRQQAEIRRLTEALDAGNRELMRVKAENERLTEGMEKDE